MRAQGSLPRYILQRVLLVIPMVLVLLTLVFLLLRVAPGDPISATLGDKVSEAYKEKQQEKLGLNDPVWVQYGRYLWGILHGNFGTTITDHRPVTQIIIDNGGATLELSVTAFVIAAILGLVLGTVAGRLRDTVPDVLIRLFGIFTYATPVFFLGLLFLLLFVAKLHWLSPGQQASAETQFLVPTRTHILLLDAIIAGNGTAVLDVLAHLALPAITLGLLLAGVFIRLVRVNILQTLQGDYIEAARARGISEGHVLRRHALRNALVPVVTVMGLQAALLLSGAVLTEATFDWPGVGNELVDYLTKRDYGAVQGIITVFAVAVVLMSMLIDIINALIDPRVRY